MKKIVLVLALAFFVMSCSNDDNNTNNKFFNLKVGSQWVYKRYDVNNEGTESYRGEIDTVKVVGVESINGKDFYRLTHSDHQFLDYELLRVNEKGHLVSPKEFVVHPGTDKSYTASRDVLNGNGTINYTLKVVSSITIEGKNYEIYPYSGYYTPNPGQSGTEGEGVVEAYSKNVGFVIRRCKYLSGTAYFEYRLVSYDLK
jgi:hypothetical protein